MHVKTVHISGTGMYLKTVQISDMNVKIYYSLQFIKLGLKAPEEVCRNTPEYSIPQQHPRKAHAVCFNQCRTLYLRMNEN